MNVFWSLNVLILLAVEELVMCAPSSGHNKSKNKIAFRDALKITQKFFCKNPQERSYYLVELMNGLYKNTSEIVDYPVCVVVRRCDKHAGCCGSPSLTCAPVISDVYYDEIQVQIKNHETKKTEWRWIQIEQHGRCECIEKENAVDTNVVKVMFINGTSSMDYKDLRKRSG